VKGARLAGVCLVLLAASASALPAQQWNDSATVALVERGIAARRRAEPDSSLTSYRTHAHGFVFFLAQAGSGLASPPRLVKADELDVEVYWRAPAISKQVIVAWRDGRWMPTDISYHRDHLGIVTNNFGDRIRIGEGDEVRDVIHPLAVEGPAIYDYRLSDSVRLQSRDTTLELYQVEVRPRDPAAARVIGVMFLERHSGDLVRFRFGFTRAAYLDHSLEDISILLENARLEGRWWLPWRQEMEIRRRLTWLDFPARSIIRSRWQIGEYDLNVDLPEEAMAGPAIGGLREPVDSGGPWTAPLAQTVEGVARPVERADLDQLRAEVGRLAEGRLLSGLPRTRLGVSALSDVARVNRVQGLALGAGVAFQAAPQVIVRPRAMFGTSDQRVTGDLRITRQTSASELTLSAGRGITDLADHPIVSGVVNSLLSQEGGRDLGDYVLLDRAALSFTGRLGAGTTATIEGGAEHSRSVRTEATPASGSYRPNPALGVGTLALGRLILGYRSQSLEGTSSTSAELRVEGGAGDRSYARLSGNLGWLVPAGPGGLALKVEGGAGTNQLPAYRSFAIGGWGTLPGEPFRAWGGRWMVLASLEYRFEVPFPAIPLGAFVSTGDRLTVAPFVAVGWAGDALPGVPWRSSDGARPIAGVSLEWFQHLVRAQGGISLHTGRLGLTLDLSPEWWGIL